MKITSKITSLIFEIGQNIIDFVFPPACPYCDKTIDSHNLFCQECFKKISFIERSICHWCGKPLFLEDISQTEKMLCPDCMNKRPVYDLARAVFIYDNFSKISILKFKYADKMEYSYQFVNLMQRAGRDLFDKTDLIIPVPMHWKRRLRRYYNQADVLGKLLAKRVHIPYSSKILFRSRYTSPQENKSFNERKHNVKDAFCVRKNTLIKGKNILLIDDVFTTGATVNNCAKALKKAGAKAVYVLTIAKALKKGDTQ